MRRWRFALTSRWMGYLAVTVAFAIACVLLGMWQWSRNEEKQAEVDRVARNYDAAPAALADLLPGLRDWRLADEWRPVELRGRYLPEKQLLVRNRPHDDDSGYEVLTPLLLDDGRVFVVDRGWLPSSNTNAERPDSVPPPPRGEVDVVARLQASEPAVPGRSAPRGQLVSIHLPDVARTIGRPTYTGAYGLVASEDPSPAVLPTRSTKPVPDLGPHLSYMIQWFLFGIMGFFGLAWAIRNEYRIRNSDDPEVRAQAEERARRRAARRTDAQEEDELLDARGL